MGPTTTSDIILMLEIHNSTKSNQNFFNIDFIVVIISMCMTIISEDPK